MILDSQLLLSDAQALTATAASTNVIDLGGDYNVGVGEEMMVVVQLDVAADDTTGDETYSVAVQTDSDVAFGSATTLGTLTITRGDAAGSRYTFLIPKDGTAEQHIRLNYTLAGTTPTATVTAFMAPAKSVDADFYYASGYTVS